MKHLFKIIIILFMALTTATSFENAANYDFIGTYGVSKDDPSQIKLSLNENNTFSYQDFSNPANKISVRGNWVLQNKTVVLKSSDASRRFHNKWKFSKDGKLARSRKGMLFYSLYKQE